MVFPGKLIPWDHFSQLLAPSQSSKENMESRISLILLKGGWEDTESAKVPEQPDNNRIFLVEKWEMIPCGMRI